MTKISKMAVSKRVMCAPLLGGPLSPQPGTSTVRLLEPMLPPGCLPESLPPRIGGPSHFIPVRDDPAIVRLMLLLPVLEQIQAGVIDVPQRCEVQVDFSMRRRSLQRGGQSGETDECRDSLQVEGQLS